MSNKIAKIYLLSLDISENPSLTIYRGYEAIEKKLIIIVIP